MLQAFKLQASRATSKNISVNQSVMLVRKQTVKERYQKSRVGTAKAARPKVAEIIFCTAGSNPA
jgi:hypothetical protein